MAGDWIKWTKGLTRKPEVIQMAHRLGRSRHETAAVLMEVWEWADDNAVLEVSGSEPDTCPGLVRLGDQSGQLLDAISGVAGLADAMTAVGWLTIRNGSLAFPNFGRHNGKSAKARALDSVRKRQSRTPDSVPRPPSVPNVSGSEPDKNRTRGEERREEKKEGEESPSTPLRRVRPKAEKKPRDPDRLFDAIAEVTRSDPSTAGSFIGSCKKKLLGADPPFTPEEVLEFGRRYRELCTWVKDSKETPTIPTLEKYIGRLRTAAPGRPDQRSARPAPPGIDLDANGAGPYHRVPAVSDGGAGPGPG
jgi:hypothetical protein